MKNNIITILIIVGVLLVAGTVYFLHRTRDNDTAPQTQTTTNTTENPKGNETTQENNMNNSSNIQNITITANGETFSATLADNETARAFASHLPLTMSMADHLSNEKHADLSESLPSNHANPGRIENGDLMLYGSRTVVLFYKSFSTSYSYTRIGQVDDPARLARVLGSGNVTVTFAVK